MIMTASTHTQTDNRQNGSIYEVGDRVVFKYLEDEDGEEFGYGTLHGRKDEHTAIVKIVLEGRRKQLIDYLDIPFADLMPHIPDKRRQTNDEE